MVFSQDHHVGCNTHIHICCGHSVLWEYKYCLWTRTICCYVTMVTLFRLLTLMLLSFSLYLPILDELLLPEVLTLWAYFVAFYFSIFACLILGVDLTQSHILCIIIFPYESRYMYMYISYIHVRVCMPVTHTATCTSTWHVKFSGCG